MNILEFIEKRDRALRSMVEIVSDIDTAIADGVINKGKDDENGHWTSPFLEVGNVTDKLLQAYLDGCKSIGALAATSVAEMKNSHTVYALILDNLLFKESCYGLDPAREIVALFKRIAAQKMRELYQNDGVTLRVNYVIDFDLKSEYPQVSDGDLIMISLSRSRVHTILRCGDVLGDKCPEHQNLISIFLEQVRSESIIGTIVKGSTYPLWQENGRVINFSIDFDAYDFVKIKEEYHKDGTRFGLFDAMVLGKQGGRAIRPQHYIKGIIWATRGELIQCENNKNNDAGR